MLIIRRIEMAKSRKDSNGRALYKGEFQRKDKKYVYQYTDPLGKTRQVYANTLLELRKKEDQLKRDQLDGMRIYVSEYATLNDVFDRYIKTKRNLKISTKNNYEYMYNHFVRDSIGQRKIKDIKYSDIKYFYIKLIEEAGVAPNTVDNVHTVLHSVFGLAHRDDIVRKNVADGAMREIKESYGKNKGIRAALSKTETQIFLEYTQNHKQYRHWLPLFQVMIGTGCRIGEIAGLRWEDVDFDNNVINIRQQVIYRADDNKDFRFQVSTLKTKNSYRTIPMMSKVRDAFIEEQEVQKVTGGNTAVIDGVSGFVFCNREGNVIMYGNVNKAIKRIVEEYNDKERVKAAKEHREAVLLPVFTCHVMRHTFCTRLCEIESNLKSIQGLMGHSDISTTADIYAEATRDMVTKSIDKLDGCDIF